MDNAVEKLIIELIEEGLNDVWIKMYLIKKFNMNNNDKIHSTIQRVSQSKFRNDIIKRDQKCIISGYHLDECDAAHIIPHSISKSYNRSNGILLNRCLHKLFDDYDFSINPDTKRIEIRQESTNKSINAYRNKEILIPDECINNIRWHYQNFLNQIISTD